MINSLYRSKDDAIVGGVCGGFGRFLGITPLFLRLFFIALLFGNAIGLLIYMLLWVIIPLDASTNRLKITGSSRNKAQNQPEVFSGVDSFNVILQESQARFFLIGGISLVLVVLLFLAPIFGINWLEWYYFERIWPLLLIFGGMILLFRRQRGEDHHV